MYLPNSDLQPTGFEPAEFIEPDGPLPVPAAVARAADDDEAPAPPGPGVPTEPGDGAAQL